MTAVALHSNLTSVRATEEDDILPIAQLWHDAWHETQAAPLPQELCDLRTLPDFERRLRAMCNTARTTGPIGNPIAFCATLSHHDAAPEHGTGELYQLFVFPTARGSGAGQALLTDAEERLRAQGHKRAHLKCLQENTGALRFYARAGWTNTGVRTVALDSSTGPIHAPCAVLIKDLEPPK